MKPIESAEEFACKRIPYIRKCVEDNVDLLESALARDIEARDNAVRLALLDEIREFAPAEPGVLWILEKLRAEHGL